MRPGSGIAGLGYRRSFPRDPTLSEHSLIHEPPVNPVTPTPPSARIPPPLPCPNWARCPIRHPIYARSATWRRRDTMRVHHRRPPPVRCRAVTDIRLLHNPKCSKSRQALELLEAAGEEPEVIRYLDTPPSRDDLAFIVDHLDVEPANLVRKDPYFKELGLNAADYTDRDAVIELLVEHPRLMERPVAIVGDKAVLGRPPENITTLLA